MRGAAPGWPAGIGRIAYVSCEPAPFARDLRILLDAGWSLASLRAFDLFPMTEHVELVGILESPGRGRARGPRTFTTRTGPDLGIARSTATLAACGPRAYALVLAVLLAAGAAGCASNSAATPTTPAPLPAGSDPVEDLAGWSAAEEAQTGIASALGERATVSDPDLGGPPLLVHATSTPTGSFGALGQGALELAGDTRLLRLAGEPTGQDPRPLENLGQGAFPTTDGSVVVRKDWKVLLVDDLRPARPVRGAADQLGAVAVTVADVILGCWAGD